jgi:hypothetical protein
MKWVSADGTEQEIDEMQDNHLFYSCRKLVQRAEKQILDTGGRKIYDQMANELRKRSFDVPIHGQEKWSDMLVRVERNDLMRAVSTEDEQFIDKLFEDIL